MPFQLKKDGPRFDIDTDRDLFDDWREKWDSFERLSGIAFITDDDEKRRVRLDALRDCLSCNTLRVLRNSPITDRNDASELLTALERHIKGNVNEIVWIRDFFRRVQRDNEPFNDWFVELQDIARRCNFARCCE